MAKFCMFADLGRELENLLNWDLSELDIAEEEQKERLKLIFEPGQSEEPISSELFILLDGNNFVELVNQAKDLEKICTITGPDFKYLKNQSALYKNNNVLIAAIDTDLRHSVEVVDLLRPYADIAKNVITLSTKSMVDYRESAGDNMRDETFIRGINSKLSYIKELQAPNMIYGVAAGIASWRSFKGLPVESYVVFIRQVLFDEDSAVKVLKLLQEIGAGNAFDYKPKRRQPSSLFL